MEVGCTPARWPHDAGLPSTFAHMLAAMDPRVSLVTLGVQDLARSRAFYEALGWHTDSTAEDDVAFFQSGGMVLALWSREELAKDSGVEDSGGWGGVTLAYNVGSPAGGGGVIAWAGRGG